MRPLARTVRNMPGIRKCGTTVSGATASPTRATKSPYSGSRRVLRIVAAAETLRPWGSSVGGAHALLAKRPTTRFVPWREGRRTPG